MIATIRLTIRDPKDVDGVALALLKSGYAVRTGRKKSGNRYENYILASKGDVDVERPEATV